MNIYDLLVSSSTVATSTIDPSRVGDDAVFSIVKFAAHAFREGEWALGAGLALTVLVALFRLLGLSKLVPKEHDKYVATAVAVLTSIAIGLQAGESWQKIASTGLAIGLMAIGGWEAIGTQLRRAFQRKPSETVVGAPAEPSARASNDAER